MNAALIGIDRDMQEVIRKVPRRSTQILHDDIKRAERMGLVVYQSTKSPRWQLTDRGQQVFEALRD